LVDGRLDVQLSKLGAVSGLEVARLSSEQPLGVRGNGSASRTSAHPLALLNRAVARDGIAIRAANDARIERPLELFLIASGAGRIAQHPRIAIELGRHARLDVVLRCLDAAEAEGWLNVVVDVVQGEGSHLSVQRLQEHGAAFHHTSLLSAEVGRDATFAAAYVDLGARIARNDVDVRLAAPGASTEIFGVFVAAPGRHVDDEIHVEHAARETRSDTNFRGIADSAGRG